MLVCGGESLKILTVVGARPQFIKAAVLSRKIQETQGVSEVLIHTGQHYDKNMSQVFFDEMSIPKPDYALDTGGGSHGEMTAAMLLGIEPIALKEKPDVILVYGDTNSTLAGALVASKLQIPLAHVEAGLRSFNMKMPEEVNRVLTDRVSRWLFCPTQVAHQNLLQEGVANHSIFDVGDIMFDATLFYKDRLKPSGDVTRFVESAEKFSLCTVHRAENTNDPDRLKSIFSALEEISKEHTVFLPLHPRTKTYLEKFGITSQSIHFASPVSYADMLYLLSHCSSVLTDSGGLQKEAYFFSKPCITLRDETEWVETVETGVNKLVGGDMEQILSAFQALKEKSCEFPQFLYGKGDAGHLILKTLLESHR